MINNGGIPNKCKDISLNKVGNTQLLTLQNYLAN